MPLFDRNKPPEQDPLDQLIAIARYKQRTPSMTPELLDLAAGTYFVSMDQG
jgi:hypothetical protein